MAASARATPTREEEECFEASDAVSVKESRVIRRRGRGTRQRRRRRRRRRSSSSSAVVSVAVCFEDNAPRGREAAVELELLVDALLELGEGRGGRLSPDAAAASAARA